MVGIFLSIPLIFAVGYLSSRRPALALSLIVVTLPTFLISWRPLGLPINTLDVLLATGFIVWLVTHWDDVRELAQSYRTQIILLLLWFIAASISLFFSPSPVDALGILKSYFILPIAFVLMLIASIKKKEDLQLFIGACAILVLYNALFAIAQKFFSGGLFGLNPITNPYWAHPATFRATGLLQYPNALGLLIAPLIPLLLGGIAVMKNIYQKIALASVALLGIVAIYLAASKGALLGIFVALVLFLLYYFKTHFKAIVILSLVGAMLAAPYSDTIISRIGLSSYSAQLRFTGWRETIALLQDNPIVGAGLAGFQTVVAPYHSTEFLEIFLYPHNILLNFWVELGIFGLFVFLALLYISLKKYRELLKTTSEHKADLLIAGLGAIIILIVHGMVDVPFFKNDLAILFLIIWAWPFIIERLSASVHRL